MLDRRAMLTVSLSLLTCNVNNEVGYVLSTYINVDTVDSIL